MSAKFQEIKTQIDTALKDSSKPWASVFGKLEEVSGVDRTNIFLGFSALTGIWLLFGFAAQLVCNSVGFVYPAYASIHAIESPQGDDDKKWLTYWTVFACFSVLEFFVDIITGWIPLYWFVKCLFLVWLMVPVEAVNGSIILYNKILRPHFIKHHVTIDEKLKQATNEAKKLAEKLN